MVQSWPIGRARTPPARTGERRLSETRARTTTPWPHAPSTAPWLAQARPSSKALLRASEQGSTRSVVGPARVGSLGGVTAGTLLIGPGVGRTWAEAMSFRTRPERIRGSVVAAAPGLPWETWQKPAEGSRYIDAQETGSEHEQLRMVLTNDLFLLALRRRRRRSFFCDARECGGVERAPVGS